MLWDILGKYDGCIMGQLGKFNLFSNLLYLRRLDRILSGIEFCEDELLTANYNLSNAQDVVVVCVMKYNISGTLICI